MDILYINGLSIETFIGIYAWEKAIRQIIRFDLEFAIHTPAISEYDAIEHAIDYDRVTKCLQTFLHDTHHDLIETLAERSATRLRDEFHLSWLKLRVAKPFAIAAAKEVGVSIERGTRSHSETPPSTAITSPVT